MTDDFPLNIENPLRSETTVRTLTSTELNLPSAERERHDDAVQWDRLVELATEIAPGNMTVAATATVEGDIAAGTSLNGTDDCGVHAAELAIWKAYSEYRAPVHRVAIVTGESDFEACNRCSHVARCFGVDPTIRIVDRDGIVVAEHSSLESLLNGGKTESEGGTTPKEEDVGGERTATSTQTGGNASDVTNNENLELEYIRFEQPVYHRKYKKLNRTFCGIDTTGTGHRSSHREPDLLDPCKPCHGESATETVEEQKANLREQLSELVTDIKPPGVEPAEFEPAELEALLDALPASFPAFKRSPTAVRYHISRAIEEVSDDPAEPTTFDRSELRASLRAITDEDVISAATNVFIWTAGGLVKRTPLAAFESQKRGGKGLLAIDLEEKEDTVRSVYLGSPRDDVFGFTNKGQVHRFRASKIPEVNRGEMGTQASNLIDLAADETVNATLMAPSLESHEYIAIVTRDGYFKRTETAEFENILNGGIRAIKLEDDEIRGVALTDGTSDILIESRCGQAIRFNETEARQMRRAAKGVRGIKLDTEDQVVDLTVIPSDQEPDIVTVTEQGFGKRTPCTKYRTQSRNGRGLIDIATNDRNGSAATVDTIGEGDHLIILSRNGRAIHILGDGISMVGRNTKGVVMMQLDQDVVVDACVVDR